MQMSFLFWSCLKEPQRYFTFFISCLVDQVLIEEQEMGSFLSVAKGSEEPPVFLEIHYKGSPNASEPPVGVCWEGD